MGNRQLSHSGERTSHPTDGLAPLREEASYPGADTAHLAEDETKRKSTSRFGWSILWLVLLTAVALASLWLGLSLRRIKSSYPGLSPSVPLAVEKSYGVNVDLAHLSPEELDETFSQMSDLGLRWIRQPFPWAEIEPEPGQFDWSPWDGVVEAANGEGLSLIAVLDTTPSWARPPDSTPFTPPVELAHFGDFARTLAQRYGDRVDHYQIWDEPNLGTHWGGQFVDPAAYAHLLREGAINLRAADATAVVLTAALAPTVEKGPLNLNEPSFLAELYAASAGPWFDVVAAQPYGFAQQPTAPAEEASLNFTRAELLRQVMVSYGDENKPIWATAFGWSALPRTWTGGASPWPSLSPQQQVTFTDQAIHYARSNWPWMGPVLFAAWDAEALATDDPRRGLALVAGETVLPQAQAIPARQINDGTSSFPDQELASVGVYPAHHPSGHYTGDWRIAPAGADVPRRPPSTLTIPFEGTRLDLTVRRGAFRGYLYVTIDGEPANALPQQAGRAYVVLYDPLGKEDSVTLARHLSDGPHIARIEAEGGWYQWPIVGWRVSREGDTRAVQLGLILALAVGTLASIGLVRSIQYASLIEIQLKLEKINAHYLALGTPAHLMIVFGVALAFYFAPGNLISLILLGLLLVAVLPRPDLGLVLVAFSLPFFLLPKSLVGRAISMSEVLLVLVALACVIRRSITLVGRSMDSRFPKSVRRLDWAAWLLTGLALLAGLLTVIPAANLGPLASADWPVLTLMSLPLAGVLAAIAQSGDGTDGPVTWRMLSLDLAVMALVGLALIATLAAQSFGISLREFHVVIWDGAAFYALVRLLPSLESKGVTLRPNDDHLAWWLMDALLLGTTFMALFAIYQFFFTDQAISAEGVRRALGTYGSPNNLALLLDRSAPILIAVMVVPLPTSADGRRLSSRANGLRRILYSLALVPTLTALILTFSKGALLLGMPAALLFIGIVRGGHVLWATLGILIVGGAAMLPLFGTARFRSMLDTSAGTGFFRLRLWQSAWAMMLDHPWLGVGLDNFLYQYRTRYILPDAWQEPNLSHPHNIVLDFGTRLGIGGIAVLLWLQIAFWRVAWRLYHRIPEGSTRALTLGLMGCMIATLAHGLVDNAFFLVDLGFIFFLTLGVTCRLAEKYE